MLHYFYRFPFGNFDFYTSILRMFGDSLGGYPPDVPIIRTVYCEVMLMIVLKL